MNWKSIVACIFASLLTATLAVQAQVPGVNSTLATVFTLAYDNATMKQTYSASRSVDLATTPTTVCSLSGSATKQVRVRRILFSGVASAQMSEPVSIIKRSTATTTGVSALVTAVPYDSANAAGTGVAEIYTTNPTTAGTLVGQLADVLIAFANYTTGVVASAYEFKFGELGQSVILRGVAQTLEVHLNNVTFGTGARVLCTFEWTEE